MSVKQAKDAMMSNATASPTANIDAMRQGFFEKCRAFGENAGSGDTSKVGWFQATVEAAWMGHIYPSSGRKKDGDPPTDAETAYRTYAEARRQKAGEMGKRIAGPDAKGSGVRISEANKMIQLGSLPLIHDVGSGGLGVFNRALKLIREDEEVKGQVDDLLLEVARRQCDPKNNQHSVPLTDDQIKDILTPEPEGEKVPKEEVELWGIVLRQTDSIIKKFPDSIEDPAVKTSRASIARRIDDLGGTKAMNKAREEAAKKEAEAKKARSVERQGASKRKAAAKKKKR